VRGRGAGGDALDALDHLDRRDADGDPDADIPAERGAAAR
jgi:hypothetical protein